MFLVWIEKSIPRAFVLEHMKDTDILNAKTTFTLDYNGNYY